MDCTLQNRDYLFMAKTHYIFFSQKNSECFYGTRACFIYVNFWELYAVNDTLYTTYEVC